MDNTTHFDPTAPVPRPPSELLHPPRSFGEFRLLRLLGEGGMGFVYLGYHEGQRRQVAIKVLADSLANSQSYIDRFYREAKSGALLNHPNIVSSLGAGQDRATGKHYMVLEYVDGLNCRALLEQYTRMSVGDAVHIACDIARALEHAHSRNIVHRDIKPDNILITRSGVAKLADLGLAKRTDEASHLTAARQGFGTPHYMPYEQAINAKYADGRSDIYALGATLYHLVTGEVPFAGDNHLEVVEKKNSGKFCPASKLVEEVPPILDEILDTMLARDPRDRYQTASELIVDLERSKLAAPVLSFADPDLARKDPWVQTYLTNADPTRLDMGGSTIDQMAKLPNGDQWYLRYCGRDGSWHKVRATTQQIAQRLREGRLPTKIEACRRDQDVFRPVRAFSEFRNIPLPQRRRLRTSASLTAQSRPRAQTLADPTILQIYPRSRLRTWMFYLGGAVAVLASVLALSYKYLLSFM